MTTTNGTDYVVMDYNKICPDCAHRFFRAPRQGGWIDVELCDKCQAQRTRKRKVKRWR